MENTVEFFYEHLKKKKAATKRFDEVIATWNLTEVLDFITECKELLPTQKKKSNSIFDFVANSSLSGGSYPCMAFDCRLLRVDTLARFASFYSDSVLIQDPFYSINTNLQNEDLDDLKYELITSLAILLNLQPLVKRGIIGFASSEFHFCGDCYQKYIKDLDFVKNKSNINSILEKRFLYKADFQAALHNNVPMIVITGPDDIVSHGAMNLILNQNNNNELLESVTKKATSGKSSFFSKKEIKHLGIIKKLTNPIMSDITIQNYYSELYGTQYVTDMEVDFNLLKSSNHSKINTVSNAIADGFSHSIPYLADIEISKLLKLRDNEGESFNVYRDSFAQAVQSVTEPDADKIKQVFNDVVRPEINNIELTIKNSRKLLWGSLVKDFAFGTGFITVGLFSGLLPANVGEIVAALGGFNFVSSSLDKLSKLTQEPSEIRNSKYYFLWKAKKK